MPIVVVLLIALCGGCAVGGGPVVGYGTRRGIYVGAAGVAGINVVHAALEIGATRRGLMGQGRLDLELNKARFTAWGVDAARPYPGLHLGLGYGRTEGTGSLATLVGPDVAIMRNTSYCRGAPAFYLGLEWRHIAGESQFALAPRYETLSDICLR